MSEQNSNSQQNCDDSQRSRQDGSAQGGGSQSTYERGRYVPLPGQGPDYVQKGSAPHPTKE
jgi:hypothetical protein